MSEPATVYEVGPRDGLQNEATPVATAAKLAFVEALARAGLTWIEATSFVSPKAVPQLADADELMRSLDRRPGVDMGRQLGQLGRAVGHGPHVVEAVPQLADVPRPVMIEQGAPHRRR